MLDPSAEREYASRRDVSFPTCGPPLWERERIKPMNRTIILFAAGLLLLPAANGEEAPLGKPGLTATYSYMKRDRIPESVVKTLSVTLGAQSTKEETPLQWLRLHATKANGETFKVWALTAQYPSPDLALARDTVTRYVLQEGTGQPLEFRHEYTGQAVLPSLGAWPYLFPRGLGDDTSGALFPSKVSYLGHVYLRGSLSEEKSATPPPEIKTLDLLPDMLLGVPHNARQKDPTRLYDESDYELVRLTKDDYEEMIDAGMTCLRVDGEQKPWVMERNVFYWGVGGEEIRYPESLYRSNYLGPALFLDEPAVCTRDHVVRPRMKENPEERKTITPQGVLEDFKNYFHEKKYEGAATALLRGLAARQDVSVGDMAFLQQNLYTWETMVATAMHQLGEGKTSPPAAIVFEPAGRIGTRRTLPEMNMAYGCQIPVDTPSNFINIIYGFTRGAARATEKSWGTSIYGSVERTEAFWFLTHAYDLGAQFFFFWDSYQLACVPYPEYLALARNLRNHVQNHPHRDLARLKRTAEVAITLPPGYNLGHVHMGRGLLWGLGELNLERKNRKGVQYRTVMGNFFTEIERCIRMGVAYDLVWDVDGLQLRDYREVVRVREDGKVEVETGGRKVVHDGPRTPARPEGTSPKLTVELAAQPGGLPARFKALANLTEGSAPVYYTVGANKQGVYENAKICWELYGPEEEDYRFLLWNNSPPKIETDDDRSTVELEFDIQQPGRYRLRAATVDRAGRTTVVWKEFEVGGASK